MASPSHVAMRANSAAGHRSGAMQLRCWELACADARSAPAWESSSRPQRPQSRECTPRGVPAKSKTLQNSRIAQMSGNTLDSAQKVLDSLSRDAQQCRDVNSVEGALPPRAGLSLPLVEKDHYYGSLS